MGERDLVIDRSRWLRGEHGGDVYLLRPCDGKMCCLGIYCLAVGVDPNDISARRYPSSLRVELPEEASWLRDDPPGRAFNRDSCTAIALAVINDDKSIDDAFRERQVAMRFASVGVRVTFVDGVPRPDSATNPKEGG